MSSVSLASHRGSEGSSFSTAITATLDAETCLALLLEAVNNTLSRTCKCCGLRLHAQLVCSSIFTPQIGSVGEDTASSPPHPNLRSQCGLHSVYLGKPAKSAGTTFQKGLLTYFIYFIIFIYLFCTPSFNEEISISRALNRLSLRSPKTVLRTV